MRGSPEEPPESNLVVRRARSRRHDHRSGIRNSGTIDVVGAYRTADFIVGRDNPNTKSGTLITFA